MGFRATKVQKHGKGEGKKRERSLTSITVSPILRGEGGKEKKGVKG